jgi:hypothetical protein
MFLEELFGSCVALFSSLIIQTPPISRGNLQRECTLISVPNSEQDEVYDGLIHREYEQEAPTEVPYYEDGMFVLMQADTRRNFSESFIRSLKTNVGLIISVVFILGSLTVGVVYVDLACEPCLEWRDKKSWQVIKASLIRVAISLAIDFAFNIISVFIQIHFYDIPMQKIWMKYWGRHVIANAIMIIVFVAYFGTVLIRVVEDDNYTSKAYKHRNCTTMF